MSRAEEFATAATAVGAVVEEVATWLDARRRIIEMVGAAPTLVDADPELADLSVTPPEDAWSAEHGVSVALGAAAQTGTVAVANGAGRARTTGVTPLHHTVCVRASQIHATYADLVSAVTSIRPLPTMVRLTTGPSRSGDIELKTIYGMHGPRSLTLLVVAEA